MGFVWVVCCLFFGVWRCFWVSFLSGLALSDAGWPPDGLNGMVHEFGSGRHCTREFRNGEDGKEFRERLTLPFPKTLKVRKP